MSWYGNSNSRRDGERDFERGGRYGYDEQRYYGHGTSDTSYRDGFDEAKRAAERRQEEREQEEAAQAAQERRRREQAEAYREEEEAFAARQQEMDFEEQPNENEQCTHGEQDARPTTGPQDG